MQERKRSARGQVGPYDILIEPPFLDEMEKAFYLGLRSAFERVLDPQDIFDFQDVSDFAFGIVEVARLREADAALPKNPLVLLELVRMFDENDDRAKRVVLSYLGDDREEAAKAVAILASIGLTPQQIKGHAVASQFEIHRAIAQLISEHQASNMRIRNMLLRKKGSLIESGAVRDPIRGKAGISEIDAGVQKRTGDQRSLSRNRVSLS
jgi:hypothetical protein